MEIIRRASDTCFGLMHNETQRFSTNSGPLILTANERDILVTFRTGGSGSMWMGAWRYAIGRVIPDNLSLHAGIRFSDILCRQCKTDTGFQTSPMSCYLGQAPVDPENETIVMSRSEGSFVVSNKWLNRRIRKGRKNAKVQSQ
jgi:hypothetical protein